LLGILEITILLNVFAPCDENLEDRS